ncbi:MAG: metalloregulator ArsR/SmtB family transcription factor [Candidatus Dormibacteria bacterium]
MSSATLRVSDAATAARFFRVLGDATRLRILGLLEEGELPVSRLVSGTGVAQARVSTHLACLRHCGFVTAERRGREVYYRLATTGVTSLVAEASVVMAPLDLGLASCSRIGPDWI